MGVSDANNAPLMSRETREEDARSARRASTDVGRVDGVVASLDLALGRPFRRIFSKAKNSDDALQIVEQILPFFQPDYTLTINDMADMGVKRDVPIVLNSISYEDSYRGDYAERRAIIYTLAFTAKFYLYGPVTSAKVIKTVQVDQYANLQDQAPKREQRYTVTPDPVTADSDDDFGFNETVSFFQDAKDRDLTTGTDKTSTND